MWRKPASPLRQKKVVLLPWRALLFAPVVAFLGFVVLLGGFHTAYAGSCSPTEVVTIAGDTGLGSLRVAIDNVCDNGTVTFDPSLEGSTITLGSQIVINKNVTIDGLGAELIAISGNHVTRIFEVTSGYHVTIDGLTLKDGAITGGSGAGINNAGVLTVTNSVVTDNNNNDANGLGAGIANFGQMSLIDSTVRKNTLNGGFGVGIYNSGVLTLTGSTIADQFSEGSTAFGGGLYNATGGIVTTLESVFQANKLSGAESKGAGAYNEGALTIESSYIGENSAGLAAGGVANNNGNVTIVNSTFYSNGAVLGGGGAIATGPLLSGKTTVRNATFVGNYASAGNGNSVAAGAGTFVSVTNSLLLTTTFSTDFSSNSPHCLGIFAIATINIGTDASCGGGLPMPGNMLPIGELGTYGGNVPVFPLLPGNFGIDILTTADCPATDARGITRPQGGMPGGIGGLPGLPGIGCDAGAFESRGFSLTLASGNNQKTLVNTVFPEPLSVGVSSTYSEPVDGGRILFAGPFGGIIGLPMPPVATMDPSSQETRISDGLATITATANANSGAYSVTVMLSPFQLPVAFALQNARLDSQTSLESHPANTVYGETIHFTATVSQLVNNSGSVDEVSITGGTPFAGNVVFYVNGEEYTTRAVNDDDSATMSTYYWDAGTYTVTAVFTGNVDYEGSVSNVVTQVINKDSSSVELTSSPNPREVEESVTFTATVSPGLIIPAGSEEISEEISIEAKKSPLTGTVEFYDGATLIGGGTLDKDRVATYTTDDLLAGARSITAVYVGNQNYISSTSSVYTQTVYKHESATEMEAAPTTVIVGELYKITTTLSSPYQAGSVGVQTISDPLAGNLAYYRNGVYMYDTPAGLLTSNVLWVYAYEPAGTYTYSAQYLGNDNYAVSNSNVVTIVVNKAESSVALVSGLNPSIYGDNVTFTATVASSVLIDAVSAQGQAFNPLSGDVVFKNGLQTLGSVTMDENGVAVFTTSRFALDAGNHTIIAEFAGNEYLNGSASSSIAQVVNKAATATTIESSRNPATMGDSVTFTASVSSDVLLASLEIDTDFGIAKSNPLSGDVVFKDGETVLGNGTLNGEGIATLTTSALAVGNHPITAEYGGNGNFNGSASSSLSQVVNAGPEEPVAPVAVNDAVGTLEGQAVSVAVLGNDIAGSNNSLNIQSVTQPDHGSAVIDGNNVVYTPAAGFSGLDSFTYVVVDGNVLTDSGTVAVLVSQQATSGQAPQVKIIDNTVGGDEQFSSDEAEIEVNVPSGVYTGTLTEKDVFYLALTWIITPTAGNSGNLQFANLSFDLSAYLNDNKLEHFVFGEPVTMTINYGEAVLGGLSPESVQLLFLDGENWSNSGVELVSHNAAERSFVVRISHLSEFALFGSSPTNLDEVDQPGNVQIFMPKLGR